MALPGRRPPDRCSRAALVMSRGDAQQLERAGAGAVRRSLCRTCRDLLEVQHRAVAAGLLPPMTTALVPRAFERQRTAHDDEKPMPVRPTVACCCADSTAPPASVSAPPPSTTARDAAAALGVDVAGERRRADVEISPTAPLPVAVGCRQKLGDIAAARWRHADAPVARIGEVGAADGGSIRRRPQRAVGDTDRGRTRAGGRVGDGDGDLVGRRAARLVGQRLQVLRDCARVVPALPSWWRRCGWRPWCRRRHRRSRNPRSL